MVKHYYAIYENGYLSRLGIGYDSPEITAEEYNRLRTLVDGKPEAPDGYECRITENGEYVFIEAPTFTPVDEPTEDDYATAGRILMGEVV